LLSNYSLFTYPAQFLLTKIDRYNRTQENVNMCAENEGLFYDFECDKNDVPKYVTYVTYRALCCYYAGKYDEAARWINNLLNENSLKKYPSAQLEVKVILALQYCMLNDYDLFNQLINSIQRQIRLMGKDSVEHILLITKILKISISDIKKNKSSKIKSLAEKFNAIEKSHFAPTMYVKMDESFINKVSSNSAF